MQREEWAIFLSGTNDFDLSMSLLDKMLHALGYGFGFIVGSGAGYLIIQYGCPKWLVEFFWVLDIRRGEKINYVTYHKDQKYNMRKG